MSNNYHDFVDFSNHELAAIIENSDAYENEAVEAALGELKKRGIENAITPIITAEEKETEKGEFAIRPWESLKNWALKVLNNHKKIENPTNVYVIVISIFSLVAYLYLLRFEFSKILIFVFRFFGSEPLNIALLHKCVCLVLIPIGLVYFFQGKKLGWIFLAFSWIQYTLWNIVGIIYSDTRYWEVLRILLIFQFLLVFAYLGLFLMLLTPRVIRHYRIDWGTCLITLMFSVLLFFAFNQAYY